MHSAAAATKSLQLCLTLCDPIAGSSSGSSVPGFLQARIVEWAAISFSNEWKWVKVKSLSHVQLFSTPWTIAHQALLSIEFPRKEYWSGLPFLSPEDLPDLGIKPMSSALAGRFFTCWVIRESPHINMPECISPPIDKHLRFWLLVKFNHQKCCSEHSCTDFCIWLQTYICITRAYIEPEHMYDQDWNAHWKSLNLWLFFKLCCVVF